MGINDITISHHLKGWLVVCDLVLDDIYDLIIV